ncbi:hypothetical protein, partial [Streptomyces brasiliscabiei]|uniref:hypothetical protein n=1 Tax=Streptomyces brasiliscabiei TaxID=2736302 RepID=UPI001C114198
PAKPTTKPDNPGNQAKEIKNNSNTGTPNVKAKEIKKKYQSAQINQYTNQTKTTNQYPYQTKPKITKNHKTNRYMHQINTPH